MPDPNSPPVRQPAPQPGGDDVLALAAKGQGGMAQGQPQGGQDPVMLAKQIIGLCLQLQQAIPQTKPVVQQFLQGLSSLGGQPGATPGGPPPAAGSPPPGTPPPGMAPGGEAPPPGM